MSYTAEHFGCSKNESRCPKYLNRVWGDLYSGSYLGMIGLDFELLVIATPTRASAENRRPATQASPETLGSPNSLLTKPQATEPWARGATITQYSSRTFFGRGGGGGGGSIIRAATLELTQGLR